MAKRILYIHGISKIGGAERDLLRLLQNLDRNRWEPMVVCPEGPLAEAVRGLVIPVHPMRLPAWRKVKDLPRLPIAVLRLYRLCRYLRADLVQVNDYWWAPVAGLVATLCGMPCVVLIRQEIEPVRIRQYRLGRMGALVAVSDRIRSVAIQAGVDPGRIAVIYSGVSLPDLERPAGAQAVRARHGIPETVPLVGTVANLFPRKGLEYLIEAVALVRPKIPEVRCLIVGDGDLHYRERLEGQVRALGLQDRVHFTGFRSDAADYLSAFDLFALSSILEGFGIVLLEAMARKKPVVATRVGGIPEIVEDGRTGILVPPGDAETLAEKILVLLEKPALSARLAAAARERVAERFSLERMVRDYEALYLKLAG